MIGTQESFTVTGGARIGWMHAGWPLAKLSASATTLSVRAALLGTYTFAPDDVIALESYGSIPIIGRGIRILHSRSDYPEQIIFSCLRNPERLLDDIRLAGFQPRATQTSRVRSRGMPVRWPPIIAMVVAWNVLFLLDFVAWEPPKRLGPFALVAVGLLLAAALAAAFGNRSSVGHEARSFGHRNCTRPDGRAGDQRILAGWFEPVLVDRALNNAAAVAGRTSHPARTALSP